MRLTGYRILTIHGDYDVLHGKKWLRSFDRPWKAKLFIAWHKLTCAKGKRSLNHSLRALKRFISRKISIVRR